MLKFLCIKAIRFYQKYLSYGTCKFYPSCSEYTLRAVSRHGAIIGCILGLFRIIRCNPFSKGGYDPVPENYFKVRWVL